MSGHETHPVADLFPMLAGDELDELAADIAERGLLHPVVLDGLGRVLDGRNRLAACERAGVEPTFETYEGDDPGGYALAVNVARRNMRPSQRYIVIEQARRLNGGTKSYRSTAEAEGVAKARIAEAAVVLDFAPDLARVVVDGGMSLDTAATEGPDYKRAESQRAQDNLDRVAAWARRKAKEYGEYSKWAIQELSTSRPIEEITYDTFVRESGLWHAGDAPPESGPGDDS